MAINLTNPMTGDAFKAEIENAVDKRGDTMAKGATLTLGKDPENDMDATPKEYVDRNIRIIKQILVFEQGYITPYEMKLVGQIKDFEEGKYFMFIDNAYEREQDSFLAQYMKPINFNNNYVLTTSGITGGSASISVLIKIDEQGKLYLGGNQTSSSLGSYTSSSFSIFLILVPCDSQNDGIELL